MVKKKKVAKLTREQKSIHCLQEKLKVFNLCSTTVLTVLGVAIKNNVKPFEIDIRPFREEYFSQISSIPDDCDRFLKKVKKELKTQGFIIRGEQKFFIGYLRNEHQFWKIKKAA